jgi:hypothetical protein
VEVITMAIDENGRVTFTPEEQAEVDRIIGERLGREKTKYADYDDLKEIVPVLQEFGYQGTPAEIKAVLRAQAEEAKKQTLLQELEAEAKQTGMTPEILAEIKVIKSKIAQYEKKEKETLQAMENRTKADQEWVKQVDAFTKKHPTVDLEKLSENQKFLRFVKGKDLPLIDLYEDFVEIIGGAEAEAIAKLQSNVDRSTSSGRQKGDASGGTYGLTPRQQELAKDGGMSFKEYAEILKHVKK